GRFLGLVRHRRRRGRYGGSRRLRLAIEPGRQRQMMRVIAPKYENADEYQPRQDRREAAVSERYDVADQRRDQREDPQHRDVKPVHAVPIDWYLRHLRPLPFKSILAQAHYAGHLGRSSAQADAPWA